MPTGLKMEYNANVQTTSAGDPLAGSCPAASLTMATSKLLLDERDD
jgi:hypothetical protein